MSVAHSRPIAASEVNSGHVDVPIRAQRGRPPSNLTLLVGQIDGKLDRVIETLIPQVGQHETRIASLERWRAYTTGGGAAILGIISLVEALRYAKVI